MKRHETRDRRRHETGGDRRQEIHLGQGVCGHKGGCRAVIRGGQTDGYSFDPIFFERFTLVT